MSYFSYPVQITVEDLKNERGLDVVSLYGGAGARGFLADVHSAVYEGGIYATGDRDIKERIIQANIEKAEAAIKRALVIQAVYMNDEGHVGTMSGITITADGQKAVVSKSELRSKVICLSAFDALRACSCPILYAGEA
jgi:hypothetical protein